MDITAIAPTAAASSFASAPWTAAEAAPPQADIARATPVSAPPQADAGPLVAAASQGGLASLMSDLIQAANMPGLPQDVQKAVNRILALRIALEGAPAPGTIRAALRASGIPPTAGTGSDMSSALQGLHQAVAGWLSQMATQPPQGAPAQQAIPPPYSGGPLTAQTAPPATLPADTQAAASQILTKTDAAQAHQDLLKAASSDLGGSAQRWMFEMPLQLGQGGNVAQFEVRREAPGGSDANAEPNWQARFSVNAEPLGPVHARLTLSGGKALISLWAERPDSAQTLQSLAPQLSKALAADHVSARLAVHGGQPSAPPAAPGTFVDRLS